MAVSLNQIGASRLLEEFQQAAVDAKGGDAVIRTGISGSRREFSVAQNDRIKGLFTWSAPNRDVAANNQTRTAFKNALLALFGCKNMDQLPQSVRDVLKSGDFDGKGHPLSARRISAVMTAVAETSAFKNVQLIRDSGFSIVDFSSAKKSPGSFASNLDLQWKSVERNIDESTSPETAGAIVDAAVSASLKGLDHLGKLRGKTPEAVFDVSEQWKPKDDEREVQAFTKALDGWSFKGDQKAQMLNIFKCLPHDMHDLLRRASNEQAAVLMPKIVDFVAQIAQKFGFINGTEKAKTVQQADFEPTTWGDGYRPQLSKGSIEAFRQKTSQFGANQTARFRKGVCQAATALWLQRHINPSKGKPLDLRATDCDDLQYRVEYADSEPGVEPFNMSLAPQVYKEVGGILDEWGSTSPLRLGNKTTPHLGKILDDMPTKGFIFLAADKSHGKYGHSMAIFRASNNEYHFFNPGKGMYKADAGVMKDIVAHNIAGWENVTTQSGHVGHATEAIPQDA